MNGILAQSAALAAHAQARWLDPRLGGDEVYWERHSTFRYVRTLTFKSLKRGLFRESEVEVASSPCEWMATFPVDARVALVCLGASTPVEASAASPFVSSARAGIAVLWDGGGNLWSPAWEAVGRYPDTKIWRVTYLARATLEVKATWQPLNEARTALADTLNDVAAFASAHEGLLGWRETFEKASQALHAPEPISPYHPDILPLEGYSLPARQLLAASVGGFVFGGMGSWNDCAFEEPEVQPRYECVTRQLYTAVLGGLVSAVNTGLLTRAWV